MKATLCCVLTIGLLIASCTKDKTDYEAERDDSVVEHVDFKEAVAINTQGYSIRIEALNGTFYKGYNAIRLIVMDRQGNVNPDIYAATFLPVKRSNSGSETSCPHQHHLSYQSANSNFSGYCVFTEAAPNAGVWELQISFTVDGKMITARHAISVQPQTNKNLNMTTFTGSDNEQYIIALIAPQKPTVSENELLAGIYKFNKTSEVTDNPLADAYIPVTGYTLQLDPRMPEPSMGNHSSPNNKDLVQEAAGLYRGVVNYTMTGNWTLNFIMQNNNGQTVKGTVVPDDFTPGVMGLKSELHLDILF